MQVKVEHLPGIHQITNEAYHKDSAISKSGWVDFGQNEYLYYVKKTYPEDFQKDDSKFALGTAFHTYVLEQHRAEKDIVVQPGTIKRKYGKEWDAFKAANEGKTIVTVDQKKTLDAMLESAMQHPRYDSLFPKEGVNEMSFFWENNDYGFIQKCRPDALPCAGSIVGLKTTGNINPWRFGKIAGDLKYHWSAYLECLGVTQCTGVSHEEYVLFVVETSPPFQTVCYRLEPDAISAAKLQVESLYGRYAQCLKTNVWPGYPDQILVLPKYAMLVDYTYLYEQEI